MSQKSVTSYRELEVWQKAMDLAMDCYKIAKLFPKSEIYGLSNQLQRAAVSVPANIAEGRGRQHTKEFIQHLSVAKGSLAELETYIFFAERMNYLKKDQLDAMIDKTAEVGRMISGLQRSLKKRLNSDSRTLSVRQAELSSVTRHSVVDLDSKPQPPIPNP